MANMKLSIKLVENSNSIRREVNKIIVGEIDVFCKKLVNKINPVIKKEIKDALLFQPEVASLSNGVLAAEFGLPDGLNRISNIIDIFSNQVYIKYNGTKTFSTSFQSSISINIIKSTYLEALTSSSASITTEDGKELNWLEWLLLFGDKIIVRDYYIDYDYNRKSRSGKAVMVKKIGSNWKVPSEFAGIQDNNFVTRALSNLDKNIIDIIEFEAKKII